MEIKSYDDFVTTLLDAGFSMGSGNDNGIFSIIGWDWNEEPPYDTPVRWHTGDMETDPWEWRMRLLDERHDIAYGKLFFKKSGYITKEFYPSFLAARRGERVLEEDYFDGEISSYAKRIYDCFSENQVLPVHVLKQLAGFSSEDKSKFDRGLTELQMKLYLTTCGRQQKVSKMGIEHGWSSTVFCTTEHFWGDAVFAEAKTIGKEEAIHKITAQVLELNPTASEKKILKFIKG